MAKRRTIADAERLIGERINALREHIEVTQHQTQIAQAQLRSLTEVQVAIESAGEDEETP